MDQERKTSRQQHGFPATLKYTIFSNNADVQKNFFSFFNRNLDNAVILYECNCKCFIQSLLGKDAK